MLKINFVVIRSNQLINGVSIGNILSYKIILKLTRTYSKLHLDYILYFALIDPVSYLK